MKSTSFQQWKFLYSALRGHHFLFWVAFCLMPLSSLLLILTPWILKHAIDGPFEEKNWSLLLIYSGIIGLCFILEYILRGLIQSLFQYIGQISLMNLRTRLVTHILHQNAGYFDKTPAGVLITRLTADIETVNELFAAGSISIILDALFVSGVLFFLFQMNPFLAFIFLSSLPATFLTMNFFRIKLKYWFNEQRIALARVTTFFEETLRGIEIIQSSRVGQFWTRSFLKVHDPYKIATFRSNLFDCFLWGAMEALMALSLAWLLFHGLSRFQLGSTATTITLGTLVAFVEYAQRVFGPIKEFSGKLTTIQRASIGLDRIQELLNDEERIPEGTVDIASGNACHIQASQLTFAYKSHLAPVLKSINFEIKTGQLVALVGETGSGKTTLTRLITRQYHGFEGDLTFNKVPLQSVRLKSLRHSIALVQQESILFTATLKDNLCLFRKNISDKRIVEALERVDAMSFVRSLPQGIHTVIGPQGIPLSAGHAQLIQLARLFLFPARLLVMDEATSQMDTESELIVQRALKEVFQHHTSLVVAHRLSTIMRADQIFVFKEGMIVERGTHDSLRSITDGVYRGLFQKQFERVVEPTT